MKSIYFIALLIVLTSCQNIFQEENSEYLRLNNTEEKVDLINGIYYLLNQVHNSDYFYLFSRADDVNQYSSKEYSKCESYCIISFMTPDYYSKAKNVYINLYSAITTANRLLAELSEEEPFLTGEVYFLRAYCYFKLARFFGTPPLVEDVDVSYSIEKPGFAEVYEFIESDMLNAIDLLPDTYSGARIPKETPHKGMAKALLSEIYLAWAGYPVNDESKYALAAQVAGEVIENAVYYNFALLDDLANLWNGNYRYNTENIFGLFFNDEELNNIGASSRNYCYEIPQIYTYFWPEFQFFLSFPDNYRKEVSLMTGSYSTQYFWYPDTTLETLLFTPFDPVNDFCNYSPSYLKWSDQETANFHMLEIKMTGSKITLYLLRYAQTLLTYAEAKARSGYLDASCIEAVNQIRRRANKLNINEPSVFDLPASLSTEQFLDSVIWERAWELCYEPEGRWFDIIRLDYKEKLKEIRNENDSPNEISSKYLTDDWYFFIIPEVDRLLNPYLEE